MKNIKYILVSILVIIYMSCTKDKVDEPVSYPALYIVNGASNNVSIIDLATNTAKRTFDLNNASFPHHISISPDKELIAVAIAGTDLSGGHGGGHGGGGITKVMILKASTGEMHHEITTEHLPHNAAFNSSGSELWIPQADSVQGEVLVYSTSDFSLISTINVGKTPSEVSFSSDGNKAFAANTMDGTVSMIDPLTKAVIKTIPVGEDPVGAWPAPNGRMYVDNETSKTITEIDGATGAVLSTINLGYKPAYVSFSTHHSEIWITDATNGKVVFYENQTGIWNVVGDLITGTDAHAIIFNKEGTIAYVSNQGANTVTVINVVDHTKLKEINVGSKPNGMAIKN